MRVQEKSKKTLRDPELAENLEDLNRDRRPAHKTLLNSVHGVNLEDLHENASTELDCQRSARQSENTVMGENRKDLHQLH